MKKLKRLLLIMLSVIFAFSPLVFVGCSFEDFPSDSGGGSGETGGGSGGSGGGSETPNPPSPITPTYKVTDYLTAGKVSYTVSTSSATQNEEFKKFASETLETTQMLALDTMLGLLQNYGGGQEEYSSIELENLKKGFGSYTISLSNKIEYIENETINNVSTQVKYTYNPDLDANKISYKNAMASQQWVFMPTGATTSTFSLFIGCDITDISSADKSSNLWKMTYAILSIVDKFYQNTNTFDTVYAEFLRDYDAIANTSSKDYKSAATDLSFIVKHSGIMPSTVDAVSTEEQAFVRFILDRVIGSNAMANDRKFLVYDNSTGDYIAPNSSDKFEGESYYYADEKAGLSYDTSNNSNSKYDGLSSFINQNELLSVKQAIEQVYAQSVANEQLTVKVWQDFNNDNKVDIALTSVIGKSIAKYRPLSYFRNYENTTSYIVDNVLKGEHNDNEKLEIKRDGVFEKYLGNNNYPTISNVFSKDFTYSEMEVSSSTTSSSSCKMEKRAYKSLLLCTKDRGLDKNSIGSIYMILESTEGVQVNLNVYARYYRNGSGFAQFDNGKGDDKSLFLIASNQNVNGPYSVKNVGGKWEEGCMFSVEFDEMFKKAKFNGIANDHTFNYEYEDINGDKKQKELYYIEPFATGYYDVSKKLANRPTGHASIFAPSPKTNPEYTSMIGPKGEKLYSYSDSNLSALTKSCEYIEIIFAASNDNPFTFGFTGFLPATEGLS